MKLRNEFAKETRLLFFYNQKCFWCGQNRWDALHHVLGRVSSSPLNACPIHNAKCHVGNGLLDTFESRAGLLQQTFRFLIENKYQLTKEDKEFVKDNKQFYLWKKSI